MGSGIQHVPSIPSHSVCCRQSVISVRHGMVDPGLRWMQLGFSKPLSLPVTPKNRHVNPWPKKKEHLPLPSLPYQSFIAPAHAVHANTASHLYRSSSHGHLDRLVFLNMTRILCRRMCSSLCMLVVEHQIMSAAPRVITNDASTDWDDTKVVENTENPMSVRQIDQRQHDGLFMA